MTEGLIEKKYEIPLLIMTIFSVALTLWALNEKTQFAINVYLLVGVAVTTAFILKIEKKMEIGYIGHIVLGAIFYPLLLFFAFGYSDLGQKLVHFKIFDFSKKKKRRKT